MADRDPFGLWGEDADDKYGIWGEATPSGRPKKRTRTKRSQARDVESPVSPEPDKEADEAPVAAPDAQDKYGLMPEPEPVLKRGPAPQQKRPGEERTEEPAWYEPLLSSTASFAQGAMQNWGDEALAGTVAATDYLGITKSGNSYDENQQILKEGADRVTRDYPIGHGAGQMAAGMAAGAMVPAAGALGVAAQGLTQAALSGASEYGDTRNGWAALGQGAIGGAMGAVGAAAGNKASKLFARSPQAAQEAELQAIKRAGRGREPAPGPLPAPVPEPPAPSPDWTAEFPGGVPPNGAPTGPAPRPDVPYKLGDVDMTPPAPLPSAPQASERELQRIALQRAQNELQPSKASRGLKGAATVAMFGGHPAAALGLRGVAALASPTARQGALKSGYLVANPEAGAATRMGAEAAWELGAPAAYGGKVNAQDAEHVAYADQATMNYALSETLHSGQTGLSPKAEQAITDAVVAGNDDVIRATDFRLRQRYPAYARRVERALKSLNEEE